MPLVPLPPTDTRPARRDRRLRRAGTIGGLTLLLLSPPCAGAAARPGGGVAAAPRAPARRAKDRRGPFWLTLLTLVACGSAGVAAADRMLGRRGVTEPTAPRALRTLVVGSAAAVALASAERPRGGWALGSSACAAGLAAQTLAVCARKLRLRIAPAAQARPAAGHAGTGARRPRRGFGAVPPASRAEAGRTLAHPHERRAEDE